jgi:glycosyltransferase involved in cell wall biosynthesis
MKILIYHPVLLPVTHYGGTERVLMWLAKSLVKSGHEVAVFAAPGSVLPDPLECITDPEALRKRIGEFDVVHSFTKLPDEWNSLTRGRLMFTIHGNGKPGERFHRNTVFLSRNHAERHGAMAYVYNGIDPDELRFDASVRPDRLLFLSKTSLKTKNLRGAMALARRHHRNLWIAGGERPLGLRLETAWMRLLGRDWKWVGSVGQSEKADFLIQGRALIFPLRWNEPFGLVVVEALASGTPVLASPYGALPELLEFAPECILRSDSDWENALTGRISLPDAHRCREWVLSKFHQDQMAREYGKLYEKVLRGEFLNPTEPETRISAEEI